MKTTLTALCLLLAIAVLGCGPQNKAGGIPSLEEAKKNLEKAGDDAAAAAKKAGDDAAAATKTAVDDIKAKATAELNKFEGGQDAIKAVTDFFTKANETLGGIKDEATAKTAEPALMKLTEEADVVKATLAKLPAEAKTLVTGAVDSGVSGLKALSEKLKAIPTVEPVVKPHLDALITKVESWK